MIAYIKGKILDLNSSSVLVLTNSGVGYEIIINELFYSQINQNEELEIFVYHHITENSSYLFGFLDLKQREIFKELIKISGIGGKVAMNILSLGLENLSQAIVGEDEKIICQIKGIGKKMASKIILELKDKDFIQVLGNSSKNEKLLKNINIGEDIKKQVLESLINMGYSRKNILQAMQELPEDKKDLGQIISFLIKKM